MMGNIVEITELTKAYGHLNVIDNVSFTIQEGKIYGLLGRNGAGKTTLMHMITAQLFKTRGELKVFGEDPFENNPVLSRICFIKEGQKYPDNFRVADVMEISQLIFPNWDQELAYSLIKEFQLPLKCRVKKLSRGMLSSVGIVVGIASRAPLTIFDEPYLGLDAVARGLFYDKLLQDYADHPRTIILSTHLIDEVSQLLEHVLLLDKGKLILNEEADALRGRASTVIGTASKIEGFLAGKEVIHRESFTGLVSATLLGRLSGHDLDHAAELGLELVPVSLQQMIVHLTNGKKDREAGAMR